MLALKIKNVTKQYPDGFKALNDVSFDVEKGDFIGLLGVNGAGKTTLISSIAGISSFTGQIEVMGHDVKVETVASKKSIGVVPQELAFDPFMTVWQTLTFQSGLYGIKNNTEWLDELLKRLHLSDKKHTKTRGLSGGMKRRLMVAQALVHKPQLIILDEPTAGVDVELRKSIWEFIGELHDNGHTIILTTHYLEEVEQLCNKIVMLDKGCVIAKQTKEELFEIASKMPIKLSLQLSSNKTDAFDGYEIIHQQKNSFVLKLAQMKDVMLIINKLHQQEIIILNMDIEKPDLEDIFLNLIGKL